jgi:homoserine kinase
MQTTITIPATSANLGPGFDCLGLALGLYNRVTFTVTAQSGWQVTVTGVDAHKVAADESNLVAHCAGLLFDRVGQRPSGLHIHQENGVPVGSGLGSSSTAVLAGLLGANEVAQRPYTTAQILHLATDIEGHPDNVAPALYGGLVLGIHTEQGLHIEPFATPPLQVVVVLPDFHLLTSAARAALPSHITLPDAVFNAARTPLVVHALQTADYAKLAIAMEDRLHQPYRVPLIPGFAQAMDAARQAGAQAVALSGAGPSLIAFATASLADIGVAAAAAFAAHGLTSRTWLLSTDTAGTQIVTTE